SVWAVAAGVLFIIIVTTLVDVGFHILGVFPPTDQPINDRQALFATLYRIIISIAGAWLTAWIAPSKPMKHAMILGLVGVVLGSIGAALTWKLELGPKWYPIILVVLSIPQCWAGAKVHERYTPKV